MPEKPIEPLTDNNTVRQSSAGAHHSNFIEGTE
jgi:hypothetical protein